MNHNSLKEPAIKILVILPGACHEMGTERYYHAATEVAGAHVVISLIIGPHVPLDFITFFSCMCRVKRALKQKTPVPILILHNVLKCLQ